MTSQINGNDAVHEIKYFDDRLPVFLNQLSASMLFGLDLHKRKV